MTPRRIGITSTIPSEILFAAGAVPVDLNNLFMTDQDPMRFLRRAKMEGFPDTTCSWICGLYGVAMERGIDAVVTVIGGDCSESLALMEVLTLKGVEVIPFAYPHSPDPALLEGEMRRLASRLGTTLEAAEERKKEMDAIRSRLHYLDELLWRDHKATGEEVQLFQLSSSDFEGDIAAFSRRLEEKIAEIEVRPPVPPALRLGYLGVPPIIKDLYGRIEAAQARVLFSEVQRQFSLPFTGSLAEAYSHYTYPYGIYARLEDITREIQRRRLDGLIHYIQSFCFRGIEDIVLRGKIDLPILTIQGDLPSRVTETMDIRIEAFLDILDYRKQK